MFLGEFKHSVDTKGRVQFPRKFLRSFQNTIVLTRGIDQCLFVFKKNDFENLVEKISSLPLSSAKSRAFARFMLSGAMTVSPDKLGRILIPEYLRKFAVLSKKIIFAGVNNRFEIWNEINWEKYKKTMEQESVAIAEELKVLGI